ncbi:linear amide C-N hydrolase [Lacticaseibacillus baoqingensis]|uniref:Linear amide C-N hydrolase n=1 Tax=Lacticaseibacillus baoqingensis TaxID=2486013 RepID=A0ABW4E820_9LACO|nr:linear amide C-N hydrolase [Lacticaseibacillus baoqingensis]
MCTSIHLVAKDLTHVLARTMDWHELGAGPVFIPREFAWQSPFDHHKYRNPYAMIGSGTIYGQRIDISDGVNEHGLCVQKLTFANGARLQTKRRSDRIQLAPYELGFWLLANCRSVADIAAHLPAIELMADNESDTKYGYPELHFAVSDPTGAIAVIEPTEQPLRLRPNPLGVVTNSPDFDVQRERLGRYVEFTPEYLAGRVPLNTPRVTTGNLSGKAIPPGSSSPGARFIRAAYYKERTDQPANEQAAIVTAWRLLDGVTVPQSLAHQPTYSVYRAAVVPESRRYYYQAYHQAAVVSLQLDAALLATAQPRVFPVADVWQPRSLNQ